MCDLHCSFNDDLPKILSSFVKFTIHAGESFACQYYIVIPSYFLCHMFCLSASLLFCVLVVDIIVVFKCIIFIIRKSLLVSVHFIMLSDNWLNKGQTGDVDHVALLVAIHVRHEGLHGPEVRHDVHVKRTDNLLVGRVQQSSPRHDTFIVYKDGYLTHLCLGLLGSFVDFIPVTNPIMKQKINNKVHLLVMLIVCKCSLAFFLDHGNCLLIPGLVEVPSLRESLNIWQTWNVNCRHLFRNTLSATYVRHMRPPIPDPPPVISTTWPVMSFSNIVEGKNNLTTLTMAK